LSEKKYHIGKNGPAPCNAHPEKPGGRACRFGEDRHGTEAELTVLWELEQEAEHSDFISGVSKAPALSEEHQRLRDGTLAALRDPARYIPLPGAIEDGVSWKAKHIAIAAALSRESLTELGYLPVRSKDRSFDHEGFSSVERLQLEDGSWSYYKSMQENSLSEWCFEDEYDCSSVTAAIAEVNAYRLSKLMGPGFDGMVPETSFRDHNGSLGTIQREVPEDEAVSRDFQLSKELREDYRKAAIFDFVMGNVDRHDENYLFGVETDSPGSKRSRIRLIDNSFGFTRNGSHANYNASDFASNRSIADPDDLDGRGYRIPSHELKLRADERDALERAKTGVEGWLKAGTIEESRGKAVFSRIDFLLGERKLSSFYEWYDSDSPWS